MTQAQLERNSKAGKACHAKYGREHMRELSRISGSRPKVTVYQEPEKINKKE
ncbi:MAG: hypothetical protein FWH42_00675 [Dehalococcoidia bacterium]|nr:hypothetical protein [Dehalococcoidia bacterium]